MATVSNEMKCCFEKLIEPLVANKSLEGPSSKLNDDILKKLDEKACEQNAKIEKLESIVSTHENTIDQLSVLITSSIEGGTVCVFME